MFLLKLNTKEMQKSIMLSDKANEIYSRSPVDLTNLNIDNSFLTHTYNWLFSFSENFFVYTYKIIYNTFDSNNFQENTNLVDKLYWFKLVSNPESGLLESVFLDQIYFSLLVFLPFFDNFYNHLINTYEFNSVIITHPEYFFLYKLYLNDFFQNYFSNMYLSLNLLTINESQISSIMMLPQLIFILILVLFLLLFYFNYYGNYNTEDNIMDHDYLTYNVTIEAEEEIGSMDDMLLTSVILLYIFLWFFWIYSWSYIGVVPSLFMTIYLFPFIYLIIFLIPLFLLYDYGSYFLTYLNGVGKSAVLMLELLFDYIAVSIFFLRLMVQNVRLVFMLFTYTELHEMIIFYSVEDNLLIGNEDHTNSSDSSKTNVNNSSYFVLFNIPNLLVGWLYELFHTFFMVIFQFIAFFAMIFWLFLFLYTMFVFETQENVFLVKRIEKKDVLKILIELKKNV
jgi:hypothetical protein